MIRNNVFRSGGGNDSDSKIATVKFRFDTETNAMVEQTKSDLFLRGPIPLPWLSRAARLPGKTINVALAVCWLKGMSGGASFKLNRNAMERFNVSVFAVRDALRRMEADGLVKLVRSPNSSPVIEVLQVSADK